MKTPIQKKIDELRKELYDKSCKPEDGLDMFTKSCISSQISVLESLIPDEEESLTSAYNDGVMHPESYDEQWFENTYNGKDE